MPWFVWVIVLEVVLMVPGRSSPVNLVLIAQSELGDKHLDEHNEMTQSSSGTHPSFRCGKW